MVFNLYRQLDGESLRLGTWRATLQPSRSQRYTLFLSRPDDSRETQARGVDPSANVLIDAYGFGRDELLDVARSMRPFDVAGLAAQDELFSRGRSGDPEARAALLQIALQSASTPAGQASYTLARQFIRQAQPLPDPRRDPYHLPQYEGRPTTTRVAEWTVASNAPARYLEVRDDAGDELFAAYGFESGGLWRYLPRADAAQFVSLGPAPQAIRLSSLGNLALTLLASPGVQLSLKQLPEGGALLRADEPAALGRYPIGAVGGGSPTEPYIADLAPERLSTELQLGAEGEPLLMRAYIVGAFGARTLVESYEILERAERPIAEAPAALREGGPPAASYTLQGFPTLPDNMSITVRGPVLASRSLTEALALSASPLYLPNDESGLQLTLVEQHHGDPIYRGAVTGELTSYAVAEGLATRLTYAIAGDPPATLRIIQGPAAPLRAFLRLQPEVPWVISRPAQLTVAGREIEAWVAQGELVYVIAELDDTLLILEAPPGWFNLQGQALLAGLRVAPRP